MKGLIKIIVTASYGKTSIKNFIYQIISQKYTTYNTPRSVNTLGGIVKDINNDLPISTQVYIVEAGARERGDIGEIRELIQPEYAIVGQIGEQHIEYFKTLDNIKATKLEAVAGENLIKGFIHKDINIIHSKLTLFPTEIRNIKSTLDGLSFELKIDDNFEYFETTILGKFNIVNISAAILMAKELNLSIEYIKERVKNLKLIKHRLFKMETGNKIIIDDSFNGNLEGILEGINLVSQYNGRKVIVTPGLIESTKEANEKIAKEIDKIFDIVIITGNFNKKVLSDNIKNTQKIFLEDKNNLQDILVSSTKDGDLILFANDAPSYV